MTSLAELSRLGLLVKPNFLHDEDCARLLAEAACGSEMSAEVYKEHRSQLDVRERRTKSVEVSASAKELILDRLQRARADLARHFETALSGCEDPQFLVYRVGDYFRPHIDRSSLSDAPDYLRHRRVSAIIFLNGCSSRSGDAFEGGTLNFFNLLSDPTWETCRSRLYPERGLLVAFFADLLHEVSPVTQGERYSVVTWFS